MAASKSRQKKIQQPVRLAERGACFGSFRWNLTDNRLSWSPGLFEIMGVDAAAFVPSMDWVRDQLLPENLAVYDRQMENMMRTGEPIDFRAHIKSPAGEPRCLRTLCEIEYDRDGNAVAVIGSCHDVTKEVEAETERARQEQLFKLISREASDIITVFDANTKNVSFVSQALERIMKLPLSALAGKWLLSRIHPDDLDRAKRAFRTPGRDEVISVDYRAKNGDDHYIWLEVSKRGVYDEQTGKHLYTLAITRDITQRKTHELEMREAQERAEAASRAKSVFLANMSHELRTPLNAIIGFSEMMQGHIFGPLGDTRYDEYANLIRDSGQHLLDLITDVLDMAKIEAGKFELSPEEFDLAALIPECIRLVRNQAREGQVELISSIGDLPQPLLADRRAIKQVVLNLLSNAIKFTPAGGQVNVVVTDDRSQVLITVRDTGIGMSANDLLRLGQPFEQARTNPHLTKGGTGLGLAICRALVEKHGGTFQIRSTERCGTIVTVELPHRASAGQQIEKR